MFAAILSGWSGLVGAAHAEDCYYPYGDLTCGDVVSVPYGPYYDDYSFHGCAPGQWGGADDVWLLSAPAGADVYVDLAENTGYGLDLGLFLYQGVCPYGTCIGAADASPGSEEHLGPELSDGSDLYLVVDEEAPYAWYYFGYDLTVGCNEACDPNELVDVDCTTDLRGTTNGGPAAFGYYTCGTPNARQLQTGTERLYSFTSQLTGLVTVRLTGLALDHDLYVLSSCDPDSCLGGSTKRGTLAESVTFAATFGVTYTVVVEGRSSGAASDYVLSFDAGAGQGCLEDCDDGVDNNGNLLFDCLDSFCLGEPVCAIGAELCGNGLDDDLDGVGDCEDPDCPDLDGDGRADACDLCPFGDDALDGDGDGVPDACDRCVGGDDRFDGDGDGVPDGCDLCPYGADTADEDLDGVPDACDLCPAHADYWDWDYDGLPDGCDPCYGTSNQDTDGEGVCDEVDACPYGSDWDDQDQDGVPDACDRCFGAIDAYDGDGDLVPDGCDACEGFPDAADADVDGVPDGCDDADGDGFLAPGDCDEDDATVHPGAAEVPYDGIDQDCDGADLCDVDGDGEGALDCGGTDCDDDDAEVAAGAAERMDDGVDNDCDGFEGRTFVAGGVGTCGCSETEGRPGFALVALALLALRRR